MRWRGGYSAGRLQSERRFNVPSRSRSCGVRQAKPQAAAVPGGKLRGPGAGASQRRGAWTWSPRGERHFGALGCRGEVPTAKQARRARRRVWRWQGRAAPRRRGPADAGRLRLAARVSLPSRSRCCCRDVGSPRDELEAARAGCWRRAGAGGWAASRQRWAAGWFDVGGSLSWLRSARCCHAAARHDADRQRAGLSEAPAAWRQRCKDVMAEAAC